MHCRARAHFAGMVRSNSLHSHCGSLMQIDQMLGQGGLHAFATRHAPPRANRTCNQADRLCVRASCWESVLGLLGGCVCLSDVQVALLRGTPVPWRQPYIIMLPPRDLPLCITSILPHSVDDPASASSIPSSAAQSLQGCLDVLQQGTRQDSRALAAPRGTVSPPNSLLLFCLFLFGEAAGWLLPRTVRKAVLVT